MNELCRRQQQQQHQQQQFEKGDFSPGLSPSGFDSKEPYDLRLGNQISYWHYEVLEEAVLKRKVAMHFPFPLNTHNL